MLRILRQRAAHQVANDRRQPLVAGQRGVGAKLQLATQDGAIIQLVQRRAAERQAQQQHRKRVHVVSDTAVAATGRMAHGRIGRLE